jgi:hypothetical protein
MPVPLADIKRKRTFAKALNNKHINYKLYIIPYEKEFLNDFARCFLLGSLR